MICFQTILSAIADFLNEAQNIGLIKEYTLTTADQNNENVPETDHLISKFLNTVKRLPPIDEHVTSSTAQPDDVTKEELEATDRSETAPKESLVQMEVDESSAAVENVTSSTAATASMTKEKSETADGSELSVKKSLIQIQVDESEIKRRISAFISRKRKEVDEWNVQEFCSRSYIEELNQPGWEGLESCARVDTVFVPRSGSKSHVKVSKVENRWGPHLQAQVKKIKQEPGEETGYQQNNSSLQAIEERLHNMESHLKLKTESSRTNIFQRLKTLEDRILFLEGISPDYFHIPGTNYQSPKTKHQAEKEKMYSSWSIDDIQKRIQTLKETLKTKNHQIKSFPATWKIGEMENGQEKISAI